MPLKSPDPFASRAERLDARINPYVALMREAAASGALPLAFGPALAELPGRWRERVASYHGLATQPSRLVVEIGCHKGLTLTAMAAAHPDVAFVGLDITFKRVVTTAQRAQALGLKNVYCALANAGALDKLFAPGELSGTVIFFPDPWVKKKRQVKNRLVAEGFCQKLRVATEAGGFCWLKTDQESYFEAASAALAGAGFTPGADFAGSLLAAEYGSAFETRFREAGLPTFGGKWLSPAESRRIFA